MLLRYWQSNLDTLISQLTLSVSAARRVVRSEPSLLSLDPPQLLATCKFWAQVLAASPTWQAELQQAGPARVAQCLMYGPIQKQHVSYLVAEGLQEKQRLLQQEVLCSRAAFTKQYPRFTAWQAAQAKAASTAAAAAAPEGQAHSTEGTGGGTVQGSQPKAAHSDGAGEWTARATPKGKLRSARQRGRAGLQGGSRKIGSSSSSSSQVEVPEQVVAELLTDLLPQPEHTSAGGGAAAGPDDDGYKAPVLAAELPAWPQHQSSTGPPGSSNIDDGRLFHGLATQHIAGTQLQVVQGVAQERGSVRSRAAAGIGAA